MLFGIFYAAFCVLGAYTENDKVLSLIWPANAFMLGMLIRFPILAGMRGWGACLGGFALIAWLIGYTPAEAVSVAIYNFGSVIAGYALLNSFARMDQLLRRPVSILYLLLGAALAAGVAGVAGSLLLAPGINDAAPLKAFPYWFSLELLNQLAILPMILAWPERGLWARQVPHLTFHDLAPLVVLALSGLMGFLFGGMAALAFPIPALLWCAISYRVFLMATLTLLFCVWAIVAMTTGLVDLSRFDATLVLSASMGAALIALGPLVVATTTATRQEVLEQLRYLAAEREIVANELEHRIKNLFALVDGLIGLSMRDTPEIAPLAKTLRGRLAALLKAHDLVDARARATDASAPGTSLQKLILTLLHPYEHANTGHITVTGTDALAAMGAVTPLALVFHELATNSTKYGALSAPDCTLRVQISQEAETIEVTWSEHAAHLHPPITAQPVGYGSKLLDLTIKSQLRGDYSREWSPQGLTIKIALPATLFSPLP